VEGTSSLVDPVMVGTAEMVVAVAADNPTQVAAETVDAPPCLELLHLALVRTWMDQDHRRKTEEPLRMEDVSCRPWSTLHCYP